MAKSSASLLKKRLDITEVIRKNGEIKVDDLAKILAVSGMIVCNGLNYLEQQGYLKRSLGGAAYIAQAGVPVVVTREAPAVRDKTSETETIYQATAQIEDGEMLFPGQDSISHKAIPFLANKERLCLLLNDLGHVVLAQEFLNGETVLLGGVLSGQGRTMEGDLVLKALGYYRPSHVLIAVDHIAKDGTPDAYNEAAVHLLSEVVTQSERVTAVVAPRPVYDGERYVVGELQQISSVVVPQAVAVEYHACLLVTGLTNSYTGSKYLTWSSTALHKANQER